MPPVARRRRSAGCSLETESIWRIEPLPFDHGLVALAREVARASGGRSEPLASGALHDAAELSRRVPSAMLFCRSRGGISHAPEEDSDEIDLAVAIEAFAALAERVLAG